nr:acetyl-CoA carboxylase biotin carboxyl carrier protein subunit [Pseudomonas azotoformans]
MAQEGQEVKAGEKLVIIEAMKMELAVIAPVSGTISAIRCVPGKPVVPGDVLVYIDSHETPTLEHDVNKPPGLVHHLVGNHANFHL